MIFLPPKIVLGEETTPKTSWKHLKPVNHQTETIGSDGSLLMPKQKHLVYLHCFIFTKKPFTQTKMHFCALPNQYVNINVNIQNMQRNQKNRNTIKTNISATTFGPYQHTDHIQKLNTTKGPHNENKNMLSKYHQVTEQI